MTVSVNITELLSGDLQFDLSVDPSSGTIGDLNGLFFDLADESLLNGLSISGSDITGTVFKADKVTKVDGYNNVNGEVANELGKFDAGVQFGTQGIGVDDIRDTSFVLSHETQSLSVDLFLGMDFATRLTSVGTEGGSREDSVKIGGTAPDEPDVSGPENIANDDSMTVSNQEGFNPGLPDFINGFSSSLLDNDTTDGAAYIGAITDVAGQTFADGMIVAGSGGGLLQINADGSVDFSANGEFDNLGADETATTTFVYEIEGGDDATLTVTVFADDGGGGGGGGGDDPFNPFGGDITPIVGTSDSGSDII